jgi:hypothetical protein
VSRTLKRPMFRRGGTVNDGIMTGIVDREKKAEGDIGTRTEEIIKAMQQYAPIPKTRLPLGEVGIALASGVDPIEALGLGYSKFTKADDLRRAALAKRRAGAVGIAIQAREAERLARLKNQKKTDYAAQTPEEQFKVRSKIYSESRIPAISNNAANLASFEIRHRDKDYVQLGFSYSNKTRKFEPQFNSVPEGAITYNPVDGRAFRREGDKFIELNPFTLEPIENVDGTE